MATFIKKQAALPANTPWSRIKPAVTRSVTINRKNEWGNDDPGLFNVPGLEFEVHTPTSDNFRTSDPKAAYQKLLGDTKMGKNLRVEDRQG